MSSDKASRIIAIGEAVRGYQAAVDDFDRLGAERMGINQTDARCLEVLTFDHPEGATPAELGAALGLTSGTVTTMIDRLVRVGFVTRSPHPDDGRRVVVTQTDKARELAWGVRRSLVERGTELLNRYSIAELDVMLDFFDRATRLQRDEEEHLRTGSSSDGGDTITRK